LKWTANLRGSMPCWEMHSLSEFLLALTGEEAGKSSKVFFCTYNTNKVSKDRGGLLSWKRSC
jgi:hypothetical protein